MTIFYKKHANVGVTDSKPLQSDWSGYRACSPGRVVWDIRCVIVRKNDALLVTPHDTTFKRASHNHMEQVKLASTSQDQKHHNHLHCHHHLLTSIHADQGWIFNPISSSLLYPPFSSPVKKVPCEVLAEWTFLGGPLEGAGHRILDVCQVLCTNGGIHHHVGTVAFWTKAPDLALSHLGNRLGSYYAQLKVWPLWHPLGSLQWSGLSYCNTQPQILPVKMDILYHSKQIFRTKRDWLRSTQSCICPSRHLFVPSKFAGEKFGGFFAVSLRTHLSLLNGLNQLSIQRFSLQVETVVLVCRLRQTWSTGDQMLGISRGDLGDIPWICALWWIWWLMMVDLAENH